MLEDDGRIGGLPSGPGNMAAPAGTLEGVRMRIVVARRTIRERNASVFDDRFPRSFCYVAFVAGNSLVGPVENKTRLHMVEPCGIFPILRLMAALALGGQLPLMDIRVAIGTVLRQTKISTGQVCV